jgi:hypothetical protein
MTDPRPRNTPPRISLSAREWKLFVIGGLGVVYAAGLGMVTTQADQLPVSQRPIIAPPPGWTIAPGASQSSFTSTAPASAARAPRILTRTS